MWMWVMGRDGWLKVMDTLWHFCPARQVEIEWMKTIRKMLNHPSLYAVCEPGLCNKAPPPELIWFRVAQQHFSSLTFITNLRSSSLCFGLVFPCKTHLSLFLGKAEENVLVSQVSVALSDDMVTFSSPFSFLLCLFICWKLSWGLDCHWLCVQPIDLTCSRFKKRKASHELSCLLSTWACERS